jgi:opacity protein-like surface antigen
VKFRAIPLFASLASCAMAAPALAQAHLMGGFQTLDPYVGASIGLLKYEESGLPSVSPGVLLVRAGVPLTSFLAIEARLGTGISGDQTDGASVSAGTFGGAYAKGSLALTPDFSIYGVAGLAVTNLHRNFLDGDTTNTGLSAGLGGDLTLMRNLALNVEWTYLPGGSDAGHGYDSNLFSVGVNYWL